MADSRSQTKDSGSVNPGVRKPQRSNFNRNREENIVSFLGALLENVGYMEVSVIFECLMHQTQPTNHQQAIN